jgi:hypothetical protein
MHPAIFPELRIVSGGLPVKNSCNFGALDENIMREKVAMSEVGFCLRREAAEQFLHVVFWSTEIEEHAAMDLSIALVYERISLRNDNQLICDVIEFAWGHAVDHSIRKGVRG